MLEAETDCELALLGDDPGINDLDTIGYENQGLENAPIFTGDVVEACGLARFPQRALFGRILATSGGGPIRSPKLYINTNAPFSGIVCGVQGSGKSHSTSVLIESCLICDKRLGTLPEPLSALLFHFNTAAGHGDVPPCEAAYIASLDKVRGGDAVPPKVAVLVLPNNLQKMREVYAGLPEVRVEPLHFASEDISGERLLAMMKVDQDQHMPLYVECIMSILRSTVTFSYANFRRELAEKKFSPGQKAMLDLRLDILDSCLQGGDTSNRVSNHFKKGQLTIIDLSSSYMDGASACSFFDIILGLFIEARTDAQGKLVVLDEAHKYLDHGGSSSRLTDSLLSVIRQQRHLGTRVLISTQEPTVVPSGFLDLCSVVIAHRFSSPKWLHHLKEHIAAVDSQWCSKMITLRTGEAMIFSPSGLILRRVSETPDVSPETVNVEAVAALSEGYLKVRSRERITMDGGRSLLATESMINKVRNGVSNPGSASASSGFKYLSPESGIPLRKSRHEASQAPLHPPPGPDTARSKSTSEADRWRSPTPEIVAETPRARPTTSTQPRTPAAASGITQSPKVQKSSKEGLRENSINIDAAIKNTQGMQVSSSQLRCQSSLAEYEPLKWVMQELAESGEACPKWAVVAEKLYWKYPGVVKTKFKTYVLGAEAAGVVNRRKKERLQLSVR